MIRCLRIENFALIDRVEIKFTHGFTVITGETGAGKSILLNALNLILGERANYNVIGKRGDKSVVEIEIDLSDFDLKSFFLENELDYFDTSILRREISSQGRSRAFINDTPVQLNVLKEFSSKIIHIHSQYNTLDLKDVNYQLEVLDILANAKNERKEVHFLFLELQALKNKLIQKRDELNVGKAQADYNSFQLSELSELNLTKINFDEIQKDLTKLENSDEFVSTLSELKNGIDHEGGILDVLNNIRVTLNRKLSIDSSFNSFSERLQNVLTELKEVCYDAEKELESVEMNPDKLDEYTRLLDKFNHVLHKHRMSNQAELLAYKENLENAVGSMEDLENDIKNLEELLVEKETQLSLLSTALHQKREYAIKEIQENLKTTLDELKLPDTELVFELKKTTDVGPFGNSKLEILFSPNKGVSAVPVHQAASGGELSRVMLALQIQMSTKTKLQSILFDEIDTGVSGDVAQKMGESLRKMGASMQVIAITHLPQVAAKGGQHLKVEKSVVNNFTTTHVIELNQKERIEETARLMSGDVINDAAIQNAKALMI